MANNRKIQGRVLASQGGFTLIEVLIAVGIFSIGMLGILSSVNSVMFNQANARNGWHGSVANTG